MKLSFITLCLSCLLSGTVIGQLVATVNLTGDTKIEPGVNNRITISVKNTQNAAIQKYQSDYVVVLIYKGSATEGQAFNRSVVMHEPLAPNATRNYDINLTGPTLPGEYGVEAYVKWGSKIVSNIDKAVMVVAEKYEVSIVPKVTSYFIERGRTRHIDLRFTITNSGNTAWPEGKYSLDFDAGTSPSGASTSDKKVFDNDPKEVEFWDMEPGVSEMFDIPQFAPPYSDGSYSFRVTLLLNGKPFEADGNGKNITLKMTVK